MDPDVCLYDIILRAKRLIDSNKFDVKELAEKVLELDEWIKKGGSLPTDWNKEFYP